MSVWQIKAAQDDAAVQEVVAKVEDALGEMGRILLKNPAQSRWYVLWWGHRITIPARNMWVKLLT